MAGTGELAEKWSGAKDKAKKAAAGDAGAKKAFEKLVKALNKDLGGQLGKVAKAAEENDRAGFDAAAEKARKIMEGYRGLIDAAAMGPLTAEMVKPMVFAIAPQKQGAIPDMMNEMRKGIVDTSKAQVFVKHSPKLSPAWLDEAVAANFQGLTSFGQMRDRFNMLEHFTKGRASFYPADLDKVVNAVDAFARDIQARADEDSLKTMAKLRATVKAQEGPVQAYADRQRKQAEDKEDTVRAAAEKTGKEIRDYAKALQTVHMRVVEIDGNSRVVVDEWRKAMGPAKKAPFIAQAGTMLTVAQKLSAAVDKLGGMQPTTDDLARTMEKTYDRGVPDAFEKLHDKAVKDLRGLDAQRRELVILIRDTVTRLAGVS